MQQGSLFKAPSCFRRGLGVVNRRLITSNQLSRCYSHNLYIFSITMADAPPPPLQMPATP